eukprot:g7715.t1 g7715   contig26:115741-116142(-)
MDQSQATETSLKINDRIVIRSEIQRIIQDRLPPRPHHPYTRKHLLHQASILESFLYRRAECLDVYTERNTLEERLVRAARAMRERRHPALFVCFDLSL